MKRPFTKLVWVGAVILRRCGLMRKMDYGGHDSVVSHNVFYRGATGDGQNCLYAWPFARSRRLVHEQQVHSVGKHCPLRNDLGLQLSRQRLLWPALAFPRRSQPRDRVWCYLWCQPILHAQRNRHCKSVWGLCGAMEISQRTGFHCRPTSNR